MNDLIKIEVPTPFTVGRVNCYAFTGEGLTLLDPGPSTKAAYETLSGELEVHGFTVTDVNQVLITHPHMDHFGLANSIVKESGAHVVAHEDAVRRLGNPVELFEREQAFFRPFLQSMGVPEQYTETTVTLPEAYMDYQEPLAVDRELSDGEAVHVGNELQAIHTPGHAPGSVCFYQPTEEVVFTGDHVLDHVSPNPLLTIAPESDEERTRSLPMYLDSLEKITRVNAEVGHSGHGERVPDMEARIKEIADHHHQRKETIADIIETAGELTAYDIMQELFPDLPATEFFPGMSEVVGHLDLLENENHVTIIEENGTWQYTLY